MEEKDEEKPTFEKQATQEVQRDWATDVDSIHISNSSKIVHNLFPKSVNDSLHPQTRAGMVGSVYSKESNDWSDDYYIRAN